MDNTPIRCRIPEHLNRLGKNQQWLANVTGISKSQISDIVNLRLNNLRIQRAKMIARYLKCGLDDLWIWEDDEQRE